MFMNNAPNYKNPHYELYSHHLSDLSIIFMGNKLELIRRAFI